MDFDLRMNYETVKEFPLKRLQAETVAEFAGFLCREDEKLETAQVRRIIDTLAER